MHHLDRYPAGNAAMGPAASLAGRRLGNDFANVGGWNMYHGDVVPGFPRHPHRGFETVTVVRTGLLDHSDSMGATARYGEGDVQWLTAGAGIQHAEMFPLLRADGGNPLELFQIWLNLPAARKMVDPHFAMLWASDVPKLRVRDEAERTTELTVVAGTLGAASAPAAPPASYASEAGADVTIWTLELEAGARFTIPAAPRGTRRTLYVYEGRSAHVAGRRVAGASAVRLEAEAEVDLVASAGPAAAVLLGGRPIGEPVARRGPFVMNTPQEIRQAFADYQRTQFGGWPWPSPEPVHARPEGRFALRPDGVIERPS
ncbi:MAG: pirin-like C-terminal cupin domain-containing protein [Myxococcota bacterium]